MRTSGYRDLGYTGSVVDQRHTRWPITQPTFDQHVEYEAGLGAASQTGGEAGRKQCQCSVSHEEIVPWTASSETLPIDKYQWKMELSIFSVTQFKWKLWQDSGQFQANYTFFFLSPFMLCLHGDVRLSNWKKGEVLPKDRGGEHLTPWYVLWL